MVIPLLGNQDLTPMLLNIGPKTGFKIGLKSVHATKIILKCKVKSVS